MANSIPNVNSFPVKVKVLREFYFKPDESKPSEKPKKQFVGAELSLTKSEFARYYSVNRVCLPAEYDDRVKAYAKPQPAGKKG